ncbi:hypothetical protein ACFQAS_08085 [Halopenitus salinus]|uniref:Uncharacterized protein n=1 Tax=Halopenitus salinus TaxID=1198295 RepID=A0ABD5UVK3_9EURY
MTQNSANTDDESDSTTESPHEHASPWSSIGRQVLMVSVLLSIVAVQPVAAQETAVCNAERLPDMIEGFFQLTTGLGIIGLAIVWQADALIEMFTLDADHKKRLERHKRSAIKSVVVLLALGPLYTVAGSMMGLPLAECVNLVPW